MKEFQRQFIDFAIEIGAIRFGEFTLKSGRLSPYFFNSGLFNTGHSLARLGEFYAAAVVDAGLDFDMLYGPAYKGIPLVSTLAIALATAHGRDYPYAFNRKEAKDHAEGGIIVGSPIKGRVLIVDDVVSSGMSTNEAVDIIQAQGGEASGLAIKLETLIPYLQDSDEHGHHLEAVEAYRTRYGAR